jgi:hypothetical protein
LSRAAEFEDKTILKLLLQKKDNEKEDESMTVTEGKRRRVY